MIGQCLSNKIKITTMSKSQKNFESKHSTSPDPSDPMWLVPRFHVHHGMTRPRCSHPNF
jgi:hypothetical protein